MAKTAVVFCSEYGSTKRYASYIAEKLQADLFSIDEARDMSTYDTIIYGGGVYAGALNGSDWLKRNQGDFGNKNLIIFTCSISDPHITKNSENIHLGLEKSLPEELLIHTEVFCFRGALDYKSLKFTHKGMLRVLYQYLKHKKERSPEEDAMLKTQNMPVDFVDFSEADALITFVKESCYGI